MKKEDMESALVEFKQSIENRFGKSARIYLFGSTARNDYNDLSDIDILAVLPGQVTNSLEEEVFSIAYNIELKFNVVFGVIVFPSLFWDSKNASSMPLYKNIQKEGIRL